MALPMSRHQKAAGKGIRFPDLGISSGKERQGHVPAGGV